MACMCISTICINSEHAYLLHTVFHVSAHLEKKYDGWLYSSVVDTMVAV